MIAIVPCWCRTDRIGGHQFTPNLPWSISPSCTRAIIWVFCRAALLPPKLRSPLALISHGTLEPLVNTLFVTQISTLAQSSIKGKKIQTFPAPSLSLITTLGKKVAQSSLQQGFCIPFLPLIFHLRSSHRHYRTLSSCATTSCQFFPDPSSLRNKTK